jgi:hypothetical protein
LDQPKKRKLGSDKQDWIATITHPSIETFRSMNDYAVVVSIIISAIVTRPHAIVLLAQAITYSGSKKGILREYCIGKSENEGLARR